MIQANPIIYKRTNTKYKRHIKLSKKESIFQLTSKITVSSPIEKIWTIQIAKNIKHFKRNPKVPITFHRILLNTNSHDFPQYITSKISKQPPWLLDSSSIDMSLHKLRNLLLPLFNIDNYLQTTKNPLWTTNFVTLMVLS